MKDNIYHTVEDLIADKSFRHWATGDRQDQHRFWDEWIAQHSDNKQLAQQALLILEGIPFEFRDRPIDPALIQAEWEKLKAKTIDQQPQPGATPRSVDNPLRRMVLTGLRVAASVAIVVVAGYLIWAWIYNPVIEHQTPFGQQLSLVLPDSTTVKLNANSKIAHRKRSPRKVWLDGEAFFEVKKKPATGSNFLVITDDLTVEVLGTSFNVAKRTNNTEVILEEGSIKLNLRDDLRQELIMTPGEMVAFSAKTGQKVEKHKVNTRPLISWKDGELQFEDVPLHQVMQRIEEIYGWKTEYLDKELSKRKISTPLPSDDLNSALLLLSKAIGIEIEKVTEERLLLLY